MANNLLYSISFFGTGSFGMGVLGADNNGKDEKNIRTNNVGNAKDGWLCSVDILRRGIPQAYSSRKNIGNDHTILVFRSHPKIV
jgi:hypothetical protein